MIEQLREGPSRRPGGRRRDHPEADVGPLMEAGVAAVYTPKDFDLNRIVRDIVELVAERNGVAASA